MTSLVPHTVESDQIQLVNWGPPSALARKCFPLLLVADTGLLR